MGFEKLILEVHENAKSKGFWDEEFDKRRALMLIITELAEAVEADRKNHRVSLEAYYLCIGEEGFEAAFLRLVKNSLEDECADVCIRLFDYAGRYCNRYANVDKYYESELKALEGIEIKCVPSYLFSITRNIQDIHYTSWVTQCIGAALGQVFYLAQVLKFDLMKHIELKMKYNASRPFKHNKNY